MIFLTLPNVLLCTQVVAQRHLEVKVEVKVCSIKQGRLINEENICLHLLLTLFHLQKAFINEIVCFYIETLPKVFYVP
jgi:hypothetical protein